MLMLEEISAPPDKVVFGHAKYYPLYHIYLTMEEMELLGALLWPTGNDLRVADGADEGLSGFKCAVVPKKDIRSDGKSEDHQFLQTTIVSNENWPGAIYPVYFVLRHLPL